jgi:DNA-binding transcriptional MerR regulator
MSSVTQHAVWTVAELARRADVSPDTVRYYERSGLVRSVSRSAAGYRHYGEAELDRLRFIQGAQRLGLRLREIRELLDVRDSGVCPCEPAETLLKRRMGEIDQEIRRLSALRSDLERMVTAIPGPTCPDPQPGTWCPPVLTNVDGGGGEGDARSVRLL